MIENSKKIVVVSKKKYSDGTIAIKLSNGRVHAGKHNYITKLLKQRYGING